MVSENKTKITADKVFKGVTTVDFDNIQGDDEILLKAIHRGLYSKTFPLPEEQEDVQDWIDRSKEEGRKPKQFISAHFTDITEAVKLSKEIDELSLQGKLDQAQKDRLLILQTQFDALTVGFVVGEQYQETNSALINYVIRNQDFDGKGSKPRYEAKEMVNDQVLQYKSFAEKNGQSLHFVGWEANNPKKTRFFDKQGRPDFQVDVMDPNRRIQILEQMLGAQNTNFQWIQPPLSPEQERCNSLFLYSYPIPGNNPTEKEKAQALYNFVNAFYETFPKPGKFKTDKNSTAPQKYADFCENSANSLDQRFSSMQSEELQEVHKVFFKKYQESPERDEVLGALRSMVFKGEDINSNNLNDIIEENLSEHPISKTHRSLIAKDLIDSLSQEFKESATETRSMAYQLKEMTNGNQSFKGKENIDKEAVEQGKENLRKYSKEQEKPKSESESVSDGKPPFGYWQRLVERSGQGIDNSGQRH